MKKPGMIVVLALLVTTWSAGPSDAAEEPACLAVDVPSVVLVDHPKNTGTATILVRNPCKRPVKMALRATEFVTAAGKPFPATVTFSGPGRAAAGSVYDATCQRRW
jgi:hypothetical protein